MIAGKCAQRGGDFFALKHNAKKQRFCSRKCRLKEKQDRNRFSPINAICSICGATFMKNSARHVMCSKSCQDKSYSSGAKGKANKRKYDAQRRYGLSYSDYDAMLEKQNGRCAICGNPPGERALHIDHDHLTGEIREMLCNECNLGIGKFKDNPVLLLRAADYVLLYQNVLEKL